MRFLSLVHLIHFGSCFSISIFVTKKERNCTWVLTHLDSRFTNRTIFYRRPSDFSGQKFELFRLLERSWWLKHSTKRQMFVFSPIYFVMRIWRVWGNVYILKIIIKVVFIWNLFSSRTCSNMLMKWNTSYRNMLVKFNDYFNAFHHYPIWLSTIEYAR